MVVLSLINLFYLEPYDIWDIETYPMSFKVAFILDFIVAMSLHWISNKNKAALDEKRAAERRKRAKVEASLKAAKTQAENDTADKENWNAMQAEARLEPQAQVHEVERKAFFSSNQKKKESMKKKGKDANLKKRLFRNARPTPHLNKIVKQPSK
ncbi:hypothetical protein TrST_g13578 [Triparma strigata]|uniref:Uncharacterized protein n=1 Tax=Triparma strigata TaxID=1606541 RepID=A0A9W7E4W5_9STRA|nr:hypothetical protein TrST_g13578 [Triparma strigata]